MLGEYMTNKLFKTIGFFCFCTAIMAAGPQKALADQESPEYQTSTAMLIRVDDMSTDIHSEPSEDSEIVGQAHTGATYDVLELVDGQWAKISAGDFEGYLNTVTAAATVAETAEEVVVDVAAERRAALVEYAVQFVGNRYVYGGTNPNTGADCSGFTSSVMRHSAGVELPHSSAGQSGYGRAVSAADVRPGDLVFYGNGSRINHVALYIGDGQVVHASNARNGIRISNWTYRNPVKIVNVMGD